MTECFLLRHQTLARDTGAHASRGQRGQCVPFGYRFHRGGALQVGVSGMLERDYALSCRSRGFFRKGCSLRAAYQSSAAALRQDLSHKYVLLDFQKNFKFYYSNYVLKFDVIDC